MIKRKNQVSVYDVALFGVEAHVVDHSDAYKVVLEHLTNTSSGCPRYRAIIILANNFNAVYEFTGHYLSEKQEVEFIVGEYLKEVYKLN